MSDRVAVSLEVAEALAAGRPVVALETSVIGQGLPSPLNLECVERMSSAIRDRAAVPAWIAVLEGRIRVGLSNDQLAAITEPGASVKVAHRDLAAALASRSAGATTVSATIWTAHRAGIAVAATGGIGGVHHGTGDVSADLLELARTPGMLVCSGPKSVVDPVATAERLDELGVALVGYRVSRLPFFLAPAADVELDHRVETPAEAAEILRAARDADVHSTVLLCNPVPAEAAMDGDEVSRAVRVCLDRAAEDGVRGKAVTPFLLSCLATETGGASLETNLALLEGNAGLAADVAAAFAGS